MTRVLYGGLLLAAALCRASTLEAAQYLIVAGTQPVQAYDAESGAFIGDWISLATRGVTYGPDGNLYVAHGNNALAPREIRRFDGQAGTFIDTFATGGFDNLPIGLDFGPDGDLYAGNATTGVVRHHDGATGAFIANAATGGSSIHFVKFGPDSNLYVSSGGANDNIRRYNPATGSLIDVFVETGIGGLENPNGFTWGPDGNLYVANLDRININQDNNILRYDGTTGAFIDEFIANGSGGLQFPTDLEFGPDGNLYVAGLGAGILRYDGTTGAFIDEFVSPALADEPEEIEFSPVFASAEASVPEPATWIMLLAGALGASVRARVRVAKGRFGARSSLMEGLGWFFPCTPLFAIVAASLRQLATAELAGAGRGGVDELIYSDQFVAPKK